MQADLEQKRLNMENPDIITIQSAAVDRCIERKIAAGFKEVLSISAYTAVIIYMWEGNYTLAAKQLLKVGVKGNAAGIAATLLYYFTTCLYEEEGWF